MKLLRISLIHVTPHWVLLLRMQILTLHSEGSLIVCNTLWRGEWVIVSIIFGPSLPSSFFASIIYFYSFFCFSISSNCFLFFSSSSVNYLLSITFFSSGLASSFSSSSSYSSSSSSAVLYRELIWIFKCILLRMYHSSSISFL